MLEVLLIFYKSQTTHWDSISLSRELRNHESFAGRVLINLEKNGFIVKEKSGYIYRPRDVLLDDEVKSINTLFKEKPIAIITFIYSSPTDKLKSFADAFILK